MNREDWLKTLKSDEGTHSWREEHGIKLDKEKQRFIDDLTSGKISGTAIAGFYGPESDYSDAYLEETIKPKEGGVYTKGYGAPYLLKGLFDRRLVFMMQLGKYLVSQFPKDIIGKSWLLSGSLVILWLFRRRFFLKLSSTFIEQINHRTVEHFTSQKRDGLSKDNWYIPPEQYNEAEKEIKRAGLLALKGKRLWERLGKAVLDFVCLALLCDNTYKWRIQDAFSNVDNERAKKNGIKEFFRILDILISREASYQDGDHVVKGISKKWRFFKILFRLFLFTSPALRSIIKRFMVNLDVSKIALDEADTYFALGFKTYNFGGRPYAERIAERERINQEKHTIFLL